MAVDFHKYKDAEKEAYTLNYEVHEPPPESGDIGFDMDNSMLAGSQEELDAKAEKKLNYIAKRNLIYGGFEGLLLTVAGTGPFGIGLGILNVVMANLLKKKKDSARIYTGIMSGLRLLISVPIFWAAVNADGVGAATLVDIVIILAIMAAPIALFAYSAVKLLLNKDIKGLFK